MADTWRLFINGQEVPLKPYDPAVLPYRLTFIANGYVFYDPRAMSSYGDGYDATAQLFRNDQMVFCGYGVRYGIAEAALLAQMRDSGTRWDIERG